jgi:5'-methylthioadenosine phosphorylase
MHNIGIIGGSGLYEIEGLSDATELRVDTPWGSPSDVIVRGTLSGRTIYFLPRHGRGHRILPTEINHRANIYALRSLGVRWIISVSAVGSLQPQYEPCHIVLPDQFYDRTSRRAEHTFFGHGIVAHIAFSDPTSAPLRKLIEQAALETGAKVHNGGTYVNIDGPAFSTRAESETHRRLGFDIVGMTNAAEAKLAREAEIAFATMSMVTDYDCWHPVEAAVTAQSVIDNLCQSVATSKAILARLIPKLPTEPTWPEHFALDNALSTDKAVWPPETVKKLGILLHRFVS